MNHEEFVRVSDNSATAVLMIHGILGTPRHFDRWMSVISQDWSVYNILLEGHGKTVKDFSKASMEKWQKQVADQLAVMREKHERIVVIAHSMGALLAMEAAMENEQKIHSMILLGVPLKLAIKPSMIGAAFRVIWGCVDEKDPAAAAMKNAYSIEPDRHLWRYLGWIPRYRELLKLIKKVRNEIHRIAVPCQVFQSRQDELISGKTETYLKRNLLMMQQVLEKSGHYYYEETDFTYLLEQAGESLKEVEEIPVGPVVRGGMPFMHM